MFPKHQMQYIVPVCIYCTVSPDMLFRWFFSASNPKKLFWKRWPVLDWHWYLWISAHGKGESSPLFITYHHDSHHLRGISPLCQLWSESKLFCSFAMITSSFSKSCNGLPWICFPLLIFRRESFVWKPVLVSHCKYAHLMLVLCLSCASFRAYFELLIVWTYL